MLSLVNINHSSLKWNYFSSPFLMKHIRRKFYFKLGLTSCPFPRICSPSPSKQNTVFKYLHVPPKQNTFFKIPTAFWNIYTVVGCNLWLQFLTVNFCFAFFAFQQRTWLYIWCLLFNSLMYCGHLKRKVNLTSHCYTLLHYK